MTFSVDDWINEARNANILEVAQSMGAKLRKQGNEHTGACPLGCCCVDGFQVNAKDGVFICRQSGAGGDVISLVQHLHGCEFMAACEIINGRPAPDRGTAVKERDPAIEREKREERRDAEIERQREEAAQAQKKMDGAAAFFERGFIGGRQFEVMPIDDTVVIDYLERRGIQPHVFDWSDLRFVPALPYRGFADPDATEETELGAFHCMIAAMRDAAGQIVAVHRTYLDGPKKLKPPGDRSRNAAKKIFGKAGGGLIMLQPPKGGVFAIAEGIESAVSWLQSARVGDFGEEWASAALGAAYSLGNLCGGATGTIPHPRPPRGRENAVIANGEPDMASKAVWIPQGVRKVILLGDADSDPCATTALLKTGAERLTRLGFEAFIHMAPKGEDWNSALAARGKAAA
jgi:hypothetical protein